MEKVSVTFTPTKLDKLNADRMVMQDGMPHWFIMFVFLTSAILVFIILLFVRAEQNVWQLVFNQCLITTSMTNLFDMYARGYWKRPTPDKPMVVTLSADREVLAIQRKNRIYHLPTKHIKISRKLNTFVVGGYFRRGALLPIDKCGDILRALAEITDVQTPKLERTEYSSLDLKD